MEQVEGGDLVVNRGDESRPKSGSSEKRELNAVEGLDATIKLAQVRRSARSTPLNSLMQALLRLSWKR